MKAADTIALQLIFVPEIRTYAPDLPGVGSILDYRDS